MHLCRGNCLSQVLPGIFIVSPDTEYSTPLSRGNAGGAAIMSAALPPLGKWRVSRRRRPQCGACGMGDGDHGAGLPTLADSFVAHLGTGNLGSGRGPRDKTWLLFLVETVSPS